MNQPSFLDRLATGALSVLRSEQFFIALLVLFGVQALFFAWTGHFSMAFDEYYHLGSIEAYAKTWLPWTVQQAPGPAELGSVTTDTSYLFHYLMSFPYRIVAAITTSEIAHINLLRTIDIAIVVAGLYIYRKLLLELGVPRAVAHAILFVVTLLPVTSWLAGQLTYDTLFFTLSGLSMLFAVRLVKQTTSSAGPSLSLTCLTAALLLLTSQVKYAFLPIGLAIGLYVMGLLAWRVRKRRVKLGTIWRNWLQEARTGSALMAMGLLLLSGVFFTQRYIVNIIEYGSPMPDCKVVLSLEDCRAYDPYGRNQAYIELGYYRDVTPANLLKYPANWFIQMMRELYFAVGPREAKYPAGLPLPVPYVTGYVLAIISLVLLVLGVSRLIRAPAEVWLIILITAFYIGALFMRNFQDYRATGVPVAIHGRYILHLLPLIAALVYLALRPAWVQARRRVVILAALAVLLLTFYGGGMMPYLLRSSDNWFWPYAVPVTQQMRSIVSPVVLQ